MNTPANNKSLREMEEGLAAMEEAVENHSFHPSGDFMLGIDSEQKAYDLLFEAIADVKAAISYVQSGVLCPECMAINNAGSRCCGSCGLELEGQ